MLLSSYNGLNDCMSKFEKLLAKLNSNSNNFSWDELTKLLHGLGFEDMSHGKTGGSRHKFYNKNKNIIINLHKPHPSPYLKDYALKQVKVKLSEEGLI